MLNLSKKCRVVGLMLAISVRKSSTAAASGVVDSSVIVVSFFSIITSLLRITVLIWDIRWVDWEDGPRHHWMD